MKKVLINILLIIVFIFIYLIQINLFTSFKIAGIMPNLFVIYVLFIGLFYSRIAGTVYGVIFGILLDLFIGRKMGVTSIMLGVTGLIGGIFDRNFSKESRFTIIIMVAICTFFYEFSVYVIKYFMYHFSFEFINFLEMLLVESIYNIILTIILYPLMQNLGYKIEEVYKGNKILTRYF